MTTDVQTIDLSQQSSTPAPSATPPAVPAANAPADKQTDQNIDFSTRFAALSRREKELVAQKESIKAQVEEANRIAELKSKAKSSPLDVLQQFGLSLDDIIAASLGEEVGPKAPEDQIAELRAEWEKEKQKQADEIAAAKKTQEEQYQKSIDEAISGFKSQIAATIRQSPDKFELISHQGAEDLVWDVTEEHYQKTGEVLDPAVAADKVEKYLEAEVIRMVKEVKKLSHLSSLFHKEPESGTVKETPYERQANTLTSDFVSNTPAVKSTYVDPEVSKREAAKLLRWTN